MMRTASLACTLLASLLALPAWAQTTGKPLDLTLPPGTLPAPASTTTQPASAPGVYYGDTSGRTAVDDPTGVPDCDDASYGQPQVHGSIGTGVIAGSHLGGNYQRGTFNLREAFGDCAHPTGGISVSVGVGRSHFHGRGH